MQDLFRNLRLRLAERSHFRVNRSWPGNLTVVVQERVTAFLAGETPASRSIAAALRSAARSRVTQVILLSTIFFLNSHQVPGGKPVMTEEMRYRIEKDLFYFNIRQVPFSEELLIKALEYENVRYRDVVLLQSRLETGYYTSDIFLNGNNLFGMKYPSRRPTVAIGIYKGHSQYAHWSDSVIDYAMWQQWFIQRGYRIDEEKDDAFYMVFLNIIPYAEDRQYIPKLVKLSQADIT